MFSVCVSNTTQSLRSGLAVTAVTPPRHPFTKDVSASVGWRELSRRGRDAPIHGSICQTTARVVRAAYGDVRAGANEEWTFTVDLRLHFILRPAKLLHLKNVLVSVLLEWTQGL